MRSGRLDAAIAAEGTTGLPSIDPRVKAGHALARGTRSPAHRAGARAQAAAARPRRGAFAERGYAETRVIDIVRAAGVAKGLFYWYFENKEALFKELAESIRLRLRRQQGAALDADARRSSTCARAPRSPSVHGRACPLLLAARGRGPQLHRRAAPGHRAAHRRHGALIRAGQADGTIRDEDPTLLALGVVGAVGHYSHFHRTGRISLPLAELAAFVGRSSCTPWPPTIRRSPTPFGARGAGPRRVGGLAGQLRRDLHRTSHGSAWSSSGPASGEVRIGEVYGAATAVIWLGGHEIPLPRRPADRLRGVPTNQDEDRKCAAS